MIRWVIGALMLAGLLIGCGNYAVTEVSSPASPSSPDSGLPHTVAPVGLRIPSIGVDSHTPWVPLGLDGQGRIKVPDIAHPEQLGWYCPMATVEDVEPVACGSPEPGRVGPAVILSHVNGSGRPGAFAKLAQIKVGDTVEVDRADRQTAVFQISKIQVVDKTRFPTNQVYDDVSHPAIRLISCGGQLDRVHHRYLGQVIAYGDLVAMRPTSR